MPRLTSSHLMSLAAALTLGACSSAFSQETPNTATTARQGAGLAASLDGPPPHDDPALDGASPSIAPETRVLTPTRTSSEERPEVATVETRLTCGIDIDRTSHGVRVTPVVRADRAVSGEYSLVVSTSGSGGSSDIRQGGPFDATPGERIALAASEVSMEQGARFKAVLKVRAGGREVCRETRS